jgi:hypothetical protein
LRISRRYLSGADFAIFGADFAMAVVATFTGKDERLEGKLGILRSYHDIFLTHMSGTRVVYVCRLAAWLVTSSAFLAQRLPFVVRISITNLSWRLFEVRASPQDLVVLCHAIAMAFPDSAIFQEPGVLRMTVCWTSENQLPEVKKLATRIFLMLVGRGKWKVGDPRDLIDVVTLVELYEDGENDFSDLHSEAMITFDMLWGIYDEDDATRFLFQYFRELLDHDVVE